METVVGPKVEVARITAIADSGTRIYIQYRNGQTADIRRHEPFEWEVGDVLLVQAERNQVELAPGGVWPEELWVGVVRLKDEDVSVVEVGGRLHVLESSEVEHRVGNTVEGRDPEGILRVLAESPIRQLDLPDVDDAVIERFKAPPAAGKLGFDDFGGLKGVVERALELIELPLEHHAAGEDRRQADQGRALHRPAGDRQDDAGADHRQQGRSGILGDQRAGGVQQVAGPERGSPAQDLRPGLR